MRKLHFISAFVLLSGLMTYAQQFPERNFTNRQSNLNFIDFEQNYNHLLWGEQTTPTLSRSARPVATSNAVLDIASLEPVQQGRNFGILQCIDNTAAQPEFTIFSHEIYRNPSNTFLIDSVRYTLFNANLQPQLTFVVRVDTILTNDVRINLTYSRGLFNSNANNREFTVLVHEFQGTINPANRRFSQWVISEQGQLIHKFENVDFLAIHRNGNVRRVLTSRFENRQHVLTPADTTFFDVWAITGVNANGPTAMSIQKTHAIGTMNLSGMTEAPLFDFKVLDGVTYYYILHYKYPFLAGTPAQGLSTPNNVGVLELFNIANSQLYRRIELPMPNWTNMAQISFIDLPEYDITRGVFTDDGTLSVLYGMRRYLATCDCFVKTLHVVNESGEIIRNMTTPLNNEMSSTRRLADLPGHPSQYALFQAGTNAKTVGSIAMFEPGTWTTVTTFNAVHAGERISTTFDRAIEGNDYVYYMFMPDVFNEGGNRKNKINIYDREGVFLRDIRFNLGPNGIDFVPALTQTTLNPFLFNRDAKKEFIGTMRSTVAGRTVLSRAIFGENGELLYIAQDNPEMGSIAGPFGTWSLDGGRTQRFLSITYQKDGVQTTFFYNLPIDNTVTLQGEGTLANPYLISCVVEFDAIRENPSAHYKIVNDIDMAPMLNYRAWVPFPAFTGTLDGQNFTIKNLKLENIIGQHVALFSRVIGNARIENLHIKDAQINVNRTDNTRFSFVAGELAGSALIRNVHVTGSITTSVALATMVDIGAIAADMVGDNILFPRIDQSSFSGVISGGSTLNRNQANIGGIAGRLRAGAQITNSSSRGTIDIVNAVAPTTGIGGIAGQLASAAHIANCYSSMNITAVNMVGGVVGRFNELSRVKGTVENSYASGRIIATGTVSGTFAGGVIGWSSENWGHTLPGNVINKTRLNAGGLVALNDTVTAIGADAVGLPAELLRRARRVVGINANTDSPGTSGTLANFGVITLDSIKNNYALATMAVGQAGKETAISSTDATHPDGANVTAEELTQSFFERIGWRFGNDAENPWVWVEGAYPILWFEVVQSVTLSDDELTLFTGKTHQLTATINPTSAINRNVTWTSSNEAVATVDENGLITAIADGVANITVTTEDGGLKAVCVITVISENYTITASAGNGGTITPSGDVVVARETDQTFTFAPDTGYKIEEVLIDGTNNADAVELGSYTFTNVTANHTIAVVFARETSLPSITNEMFNVYPNPISDVMHIQTEQNIQQITVLDMQGRVVMHQQGDNRTINMQAIPAGNYTVRIYTETGVASIRIVKQ